MNPALLHQIERVPNGVLATVLSTDGHTYKKRGAKALFSMDSPLPVHGNLGSLCVDQEAIRQAKEAYELRLPRAITIDTTKAEDVHFGYGSFCGGTMDLLVEPVLDRHKDEYRSVRAYLAANCEVELIHELASGPVEELLHPPVPLCVFGASPLAQVLAAQVRDMPLQMHVHDWRPPYLAEFEHIPHVEVHDEKIAIDGRWFVLVLSHSYARDIELLFEAVSKDCPYVGLLSSKKRRDAMYAELEERGVSREALDRVHSPVGLDLGGRSDVEIAVSIAAELVQSMNDDSLRRDTGRTRHTLRIR